MSKLSKGPKPKTGAVVSESNNSFDAAVLQFRVAFKPKFTRKQLFVTRQLFKFEKKYMKKTH